MNLQITLKSTWLSHDQEVFFTSFSYSWRRGNWRWRSAELFTQLVFLFWSRRTCSVVMIILEGKYWWQWISLQMDRGEQFWETGYYSLVEIHLRLCLHTSLMDPWNLIASTLQMIKRESKHGNFQLGKWYNWTPFSREVPPSWIPTFLVYVMYRDLGVSNTPFTVCNPILLCDELIIEELASNIFASIWFPPPLLNSVKTACMTGTLLKGLVWEYGGLLVTFFYNCFYMLFP